MWLVSWPDKKKKRKRGTGALQALNCLDDLDPAGLIDELAIQLWPRGARFAVLHVVPNRLSLASIRRSCVFSDGALSAFGQREVKSTFTLLYPSIGGWWAVSSIFVFSFQKDLFTFPRSSRERSRWLFSPGSLCFGPILSFPLLWVPDHGHRLLYSSDTT